MSKRMLYILGLLYSFTFFDCKAVSGSGCNEDLKQSYTSLSIEVTDSVYSEIKFVNCTKSSEVISIAAMQGFQPLGGGYYIVTDIKSGSTLDYKGVIREDVIYTQSSLIEVPVGRSIQFRHNLSKYYDFKKNRTYEIYFMSPRYTRSPEPNNEPLLNHDTNKVVFETNFIETN
jgi:hypothetical protein